ncbi:UbiA prenyltransferase family-domain-containing protein [Cladorrhinum sp. PSN259]|nr:UbiA prenyltransferase family-domain-containing protein [Cladorrhinum sp. PSN259]
MRQPLRGIALLWGFIESDFVTFAVPNTAFGVFGALASSMLAVSVSSAHLSAAQILRRLPLVLAYNVANLIIFDLANQRTERSVAEDKLNKPWRPIPQGKITPEQTRRLMLAVIPFVLALNYLLGGWNQGLLITVLSWMYNDLGGGDEAFVREMVISVAYGLFNSGSLAVAVGPAYSVLSPLGLAWTVIVSGVILTTMQVQDLKDQAGDRLRGRKTICLYLGENFSRTSIAFFVGFWSCVCGYFWALGPLTFSLVALIAAVVAVRVLFVRSPSEDAKTWRLWCLWHASLYTLPVLIATDI